MTEPPGDHPLYAIGKYRGSLTETFAGLHRLLKEQHVDIVMAGDTHAFEHYSEIHGNGRERVMHHFTNGGGGAFLGIETPLEWPATTVFPAFRQSAISGTISRFILAKVLYNFEQHP